MSRAKSGIVSKKRHRKVLKLAKGYRGRSNSCFSIAIEKVEKALRYAYRDRRNRKREFRSLWIQRINAAAREEGLTYSEFICSLRKKGIQVNRKILSDIAISGFKSFIQAVSKIEDISKPPLLVA